MNWLMKKLMDTDVFREWDAERKRELDGILRTKYHAMSKEDFVLIVVPPDAPQDMFDEIEEHMQAAGIAGLVVDGNVDVFRLT